MKKNLFLASLILFITLPVLASARTIMSSRTFGGFCMPPGCPETEVKLSVNQNGWGKVQEIKLDADGNVTSKQTLSWLPPKTMKRILEAVEKVEKSRLYDVEDEEPIIMDIPSTEYKIYKLSQDEITIGKQEMGHLWLQKNRQGYSLLKLLQNFSSISFISNY